MSDIIIKPEVVEAKEKQKARDKQHERRRIALEMGKARMTAAGHQGITHTAFWKEMLGYADALIDLTDPEKP